MQVAVCVITYQRPEGLARLLDGLNRLAFSGDPPAVRCIVVDNDPADTAREVCDRIRPDFRWKLDCHLEPRRGIPFARNRAVACALDDADFVAFIDDDEVPAPSWLQELLDAQRRYSADVVTGPMVRRFLSEVPAWLAKSRFFEVPRYPTGTELPAAMTSNVLARAEAFRAVEGPFDEGRALTGGSDTHCFRRIHRAGFRIVWSDESVVYEYVPASRATLSWLLQRAYRLGNNWSLIELDLQPCWATRGRILFRSPERVARGLVLLVAGLVMGRLGLARALYNFCYAAGLIAGLVGMRYEEYRRVHGE